MIKEHTKYIWSPQEAAQHLIQHMRTWAKETNADKFVIGLSGGKDSTVVALALVLAFGTERVIGVTLPDKQTPQPIDFTDPPVHRIAAALGIPLVSISIREAHHSIAEQLWEGRLCTPVYPTKDMEINLPARLRMATLFAVGQCTNGRVINTSNLSEDIMGYATQFGDNAGCYAPLQGLTVTEVIDMGKYMVEQLDLSKLSAKRASEIRYMLCDMLEIPPSDGLQEKTDEERFGFAYNALDKVIRQGRGILPLDPTWCENTEEDLFKPIAEIAKAAWVRNKFKLDIVRMPGPFVKGNIIVPGKLELPNYIWYPRTGFLESEYVC